QAPQVGVVTIQPQAFTLTSELPGRTSAYRVAEVRPQVNGIILKRLFKEGSEVKEGQQLYQIDPAVYEATLANAQANLQ
ncbi:biotin/lipoyl-binding protein, partial [Pseudomonas sp. SIMBA_059]